MITNSYLGIIVVLNNTEEVSLLLKSIDIATHKYLNQILADI